MKQITKIALKTALVSLTTYVTSSLVIKGIFRRVIEKRQIQCSSSLNRRNKET